MKLRAALQRAYGSVLCRCAPDNSGGCTERPPVTWTECGTNTGSRNSDGNVPNCNWNDGKFYVNAYNADNSNSNLRAREEVSRRKVPCGGLFSLHIREPSGSHFRSLYNFILQKKVFIFLYYLKLLTQPNEALADCQCYAELFYWAYFCRRPRQRGFDRQRQTGKYCIFDARIQSKPLPLRN